MIFCVGSNSNRIVFLLCSTLVLLFIVRQALGEWPDDPEQNVPICTANGIQEHPRITTDGSAGAIIVWQDISSSSSDIYAQRIDARGVIRWAKDGVAICLEKGDQWFPNLVSDGKGGAIIAWWDRRNGISNTDIYAQRIDADGNILWQPGGVPICTAQSEQKEFDIIPDGFGGAIITWHDYRHINVEGAAPDIYAQRIDAQGRILWKPDGVPVCRALGSQNYPNLISDGLGGAIITWHDWRHGNGDIYAQHINSNGEPSWEKDGIPICKVDGHQWYPAIVSDGARGAIIIWMDQRNGKDWDIYAQRISDHGKILWEPNGVPICVAKGDQYDYVMTPCTDGAYVVWRDQRNGNWDIYAQKIGIDSKLRWQRDGIVICVEPGDQYNPNLVTDRSDGIIITWWDERDGQADIYAQRLDPKGNELWTKGGVAISVAHGGQQDAYPIDSGVGSAIIVWWDKRGTDPDIYAQRVFSER